MVADVSRVPPQPSWSAPAGCWSTASPVSVGQDVLREGSDLTDPRSPAGRRRAWRPSRASASRSSTPTTTVAVVDKPAGLVVHPGAGHDEGTLVGGLLARFPDLAAAGGRGRVPTRPARHRAPARQGHLGAPGRGPHRAEAYAGARRPAGHPDDGTPLPGPGARERWPRTGARWRRPSAARPARRPRWRSPPRASRPARRTRCWNAGRPRRRRRPTTLLELALQSGRTHQIRVHMAAIGHPVVGDARYGTRGQAPGQRPVLPACLQAGLRPPDGREPAWSSRRRCPTTWRRTSASGRAGSLGRSGRPGPVRRPGGRRPRRRRTRAQPSASSSARRTRRTPTPSRSAVDCSEAGESPSKPKRSRSTSRWRSGRRSTASRTRS